MLYDDKIFLQAVDLFFKANMQMIYFIKSYENRSFFCLQFAYKLHMDDAQNYNSGKCCLIFTEKAFTSGINFLLVRDKALSSWPKTQDSMFVFSWYVWN